MRWGSSRKHHHGAECATRQGEALSWGSSRKHHGAKCAQDQGEAGERKGKGSKTSFSSFSPLSWLVAKLAGKPRAAAAKAGPEHPHAPEDGPAVPSTCLAKGTTSPATAAITPPRRSTPAGVDVVPRRLSVGNDSAAAAARHRRRHCSVGGERDLIQPLGQLISFSLAGTPALPPSGTGTGARAPQRRRRARGRHRHSGRSSFSGRVMPLRVRVRRVAAPELESLAVVRRTRDPQRAFRESMSEMIVASGGGARPEELERLLACYLALNADEHHGCIVKVFRQVWFEHVRNNLPLLPRRPAADRSSQPAEQRSVVN